MGEEELTMIWSMPLDEAIITSLVYALYFMFVPVIFLGMGLTYLAANWLTNRRWFRRWFA